jgi:type II secretory pathway pseudopilin PulG
MKREGGYTLLELLLALTLASFLLALVLPGLTRLYGRYELDVAARIIVADIRSDQTAAAARAQVREMVFDRFTPVYIQRSDGAYRRRVVLSPSLSYRNGYLEQWVSRLRFDPSGMTTGTGSVRLVNRARESADVIVQVTYGNVLYEGVKPR